MMIAYWGFALIAWSHVVLSKEPMPAPEYLDMLRATGQDEEFAKLAGIRDASLVRGTTERRIDNFTMVSHLGDILLTADEEEQARQGLNFNKWSGNKWRNVIPYYISPQDFSSEQIQTIEAAISSMNENLQVLQLRHWASGDDDYVYVISGSGCWSYLGKIGGWQPLSLQSGGCVWNNIVIHEFMHAAGLQHEHNRPDRDHHVRILWQNIPQEWHSQYYTGSYQDYAIHGDYDPYSIMHYGINAPGTNKPAFQFCTCWVEVDYVGYGATWGDYFKLNNIYT